MSTVLAAMSGVVTTLIDAKTTGTSDALALPPSFRNHTVIIKGNSTVSTGAVQIETAHEFDYSGTWAQIGGGPITVVDGTDVVANFTGIFNFIRARVTTNITGAGGSVTVTYEGAKSY